MAAEEQNSALDDAGLEERGERGRQIYMEGLLPSGKPVTAVVQGDIEVTGELVVCGFCHRRSGLGSSEGQDVVPAVTGDMLYDPLRLPTSKAPLAPELRPAYTDATLKRAIQAGIGAGGATLSALMPRYAMSDEDLDSLMAYLKTLNTDPDPGVSHREIHFATIVADSVEPGTRKALVDVFETFIAQKNTETRNEGRRAEHAPWHKKWNFEPYRKWVLHVWELEGSPASWSEQLQTLYDQQPVFAVLSGVAPGSWQPMHAFCQQNKIPCLFPNTDLPVVNEDDFYSVYFTRGMALEADTIVQHLADDDLISGPIVQIYAEGDPRARTAAVRLRDQVDRQGGSVTDLILSGPSALTDNVWQAINQETEGGTLVLWLGPAVRSEIWTQSLSSDGGGPRRIYLSTTLYGREPQMIPAESRKQIYLVHPYELPGRLPRLLARSTGWLKVKHIYAPDAQRVQANAFFALKTVGGALTLMRGFFVRDYLLETIEHMIDNASYTSVYPRISLAPGQRFLSRAAYITRFARAEDRDLLTVTDWLVPGSQ